MVEDVEGFGPGFDVMTLGDREAPHHRHVDRKAPGPCRLFRPEFPNVPSALERNAVVLNHWLSDGLLTTGIGDDVRPVGTDAG